MAMIPRPVLQCVQCGIKVNGTTGLGTPRADRSGSRHARSVSVLRPHVVEESKHFGGCPPVSRARISTATTDIVYNSA